MRKTWANHPADWALAVALALFIPTLTACGHPDGDPSTGNRGNGNGSRPPAGWGDFRFGLVSDGKALFDARMASAVADGIRLDYRYAYVNHGPDPETNAYSWLFGAWNDGYVMGSEALGLRPAFVIYMLQEDGGIETMARNAQDTEFLRKYFTTLKLVAEKAKGYKAIFVVEPDTWGYLLQKGVDPLEAKAAVSSIAGDFPFLAGMPDTYSGLAQAIIRTLKTYAPDAYVGALMSHWTVNAEECPGEDMPDSYMGMPYQSAADIDCSADRNAAFARNLLGDGSDRGDFIGVEKNGHSAGWWYEFLEGDESYRRMYAWNDNQNANFVRWCARLGKGLDLPILGWQISIGSPGLPNACGPGPLSDTVRFGLETGNCAFEDTFFPYFFTHPREFLDAGFIGFLAGKGLGDDTDYAHASIEPEMGDRGWFFNQLKTFDRGRPYLSGSR